MTYEHPTLFGPSPGLVRHDARDTSRAAALFVESKTGKDRRRIVGHLKEQGDDGATDKEMQIALALDGNTQRPRRCELVDAGWVIDSGHRRDRHAVWILAPDKTGNPP